MPVALQQQACWNRGPWQPAWLSPGSAHTPYLGLWRVTRDLDRAWRRVSGPNAAAAGIGRLRQGAALVGQTRRVHNLLRRRQPREGLRRWRQRLCWQPGSRSRQRWRRCAAQKAGQLPCDEALRLTALPGGPGYFLCLLNTSWMCCFQVQSSDVPRCSWHYNLIKCPGWFTRNFHKQTWLCNLLLTSHLPESTTSRRCRSKAFHSHLKQLIFLDWRIWSYDSL